MVKQLSILSGVSNAEHIPALKAEASPLLNEGGFSSLFVGAQSVSLASTEELSESLNEGDDASVALIKDFDQEIIESVIPQLQLKDDSLSSYSVVVESLEKETLPLTEIEELDLMAEFIQKMPGAVEVSAWTEDPKGKLDLTRVDVESPIKNDAKASDFSSLILFQPLEADKKYVLSEDKIRSPINLTDKMTGSAMNPIVRPTIPLSKSVSVFSFISGEPNSFGEKSSAFSSQQNDAFWIKQTLVKQGNVLSQSPMVFSEIMPDTERKEKILGELGIGFDRRSELPLSMQTIGTNVRSQRWGQELGQRLVFMVNKDIKEAKIKLSPEKLGPIQIKITLDKDQQMSITIVAQNGTTRGLLENAIPKLREMLEDSNAEVVNVDVNEDSNAENYSESKDKGTPQNKIGMQSEGSVEQDKVVSRLVQSSDNIVDYYA